MRLPDGRVVIASGTDSGSRPGAYGPVGILTPPQAEVWTPAAPDARPYNISYPPTWEQGWMGYGWYPFMAVLPKGEDSNSKLGKGGERANGIELTVHVACTYTSAEAFPTAYGNYLAGMAHVAPRP